MKHVPLLQGLVFRIHITPIGGTAVIGRLEEEGDFVFESEFESYRDAYWVLMKLDGNEYISTNKAASTKNIE